MIIVISDTSLFAGEANIVNQLYDNGLLLFHLRKYNNSKSEIVEFVNAIKPEYRNRIVLHQFHEMANDFGISRLHFSEKDRVNTNEVEFNRLKEEGMILSTSVHSVDEYNVLPLCFDYAFLSPVFDSISKDNYKARPFDLKQRKTTSIKLIALGGVKEDNCSKAYEMGFDGIALLGSIWKSENKVESFENVALRLSQMKSLSLANISLRYSANNFASSARN